MCLKMRKYSSDGACRYIEPHADLIMRNDPRESDNSPLHLQAGFPAFPHVCEVVGGQ
jgi:hypothetical protein